MIGSIDFQLVVNIWRLVREVYVVICLVVVVMFTMYWKYYFRCLVTEASWLFGIGHCIAIVLLFTTQRCGEAASRQTAS